jgi:hypothetical protein
MTGLNKKVATSQFSQLLGRLGLTSKGELNYFTYTAIIFNITLLGIEPKRENELNDKAELEALAEIIKQASYQDYKMAYDVAAIIIIP